MKSIGAIVRFVVPTLGKNLDWLTLTLKSVADQPISTDLVLVAPADSKLESLASRYGARVVSERGRSLAEALNQGFEDLQESVRYLAWLGDDDVLAPGSLGYSVEALERNPDASLVLGRLRYIDGDGRSKWVVRSGAWAARYARLGKNFMGQPGSLFRRESYEKVGGLDPELKNSMDQDLYMKLSRVGRVLYVGHELAAFRVHSASISSTKGPKDESGMVSSRYAPAIPQALMPAVKPAIRVTDRILLSVLCRIPHAAAPEVAGRPYYELDPFQQDRLNFD